MISTESRPNNGSRPKGSVLIVDDNPANLRLLSGILAENGYKVRPAPSGDLALQSVRSTLPDLVLLDIKMPGMDGYEVCRRLKADERTRDVPVLFISALAEVADKVKGFAVGGVDYITKPFQNEEVLARVATHVSLAQMHNRLEEQNLRLQQEIAGRKKVQKALKKANDELEDRVKKRTSELSAANTQLKHEIVERKGAEARESHLNKVLRAVRDVNQLIVREKDRDRLLKQACTILVEAPFYLHAWIVLFDESGKAIATAEAGLGDNFSALVRQLEQGNPPSCVQNTLSQSAVLFIKNTASICSNCHLPYKCRDRGAMVVRLEHGEKVFGILAVAVPLDVVLDEEECSLILELAGDIAFALYSHEQEKKKALAKKALRESEEKFRDLANSLPQVVYEADATGILTYVNRNAFDFFGYSQSDLDKGMSAFDILIPEDRDRAMENVQCILQGGTTAGVEYTALKKDGGTFPVVAHTNSVEREGRAIGVRGLIIDLTDRKKMEADIQRRAMAMDYSSDTIVITDTSGTITYVNPAFEKISGYSREEAIGNNSRILQSGKQDKAFYQHLWHTISNGETWTGRFINKKKDGSHFTEEATLSPVFSASGKIVNYLAVKRDITDKINLEDQLRQAQKMEAIGTLAGGIAHDFNNMLSVVMGFTQLAKVEIDNPDRLREYLDEVLEGANRAKKLVQQILAFSRKSEQQLKPLRLQLLIKEVLKLLRSSIPTTIEIRQNINPDCKTILADPTQIHQVIMNLCTNAYHAMREKGGVLDISLQPIILNEEDVSSKLHLTPGEYVKLEVGDTGIGMTKDVLQKIFEPYYTTKEKGAGTGLGLAVVHGIITDLHGDISVYSEAGKGTTFNVYIPISEATEETFQQEELTLPLPIGDEHILLVDDEEVVTRVYKKILEKLGYKITALSSSLDAIKIFREDPDSFDLVITDMTMPKMTGAELAQEILAIRPGIPIILCSGYSELINEEIAKAIGIRDYIMKPVDNKDFAEIIRKVLDAS